MVFAVREIKEQSGLTYQGAVPVDALAAEGAFGEASPKGPASVDLEFSVGGSHILLEGSVDCLWQLPCSRCLGPVEVTFGEDLEETYPLTQDTIDLTEDLRQALALSIPERILCREDCQGLCATCGANKNLGPCRCEVQGTR